MLDPVARVDPEERVPAELLAFVLADAGVSGAALARRLHVDAGTVSDWKHGRIPISPSRWLAVCAALREMNPQWSPPDWKPGDDPPTRLS